MKAHNLVIVLLLFILIGCKNNSSYNENKEIGLRAMENNFINDSVQDRNENPQLYDFLYRDIIYDKEETKDKAEITEEYFRVEVELINDYLKKVSYKFLSREEYLSKVKAIFKYKIIDNAAEIFSLRSYSNNCDIYDKNDKSYFQVDEGIERDEYYSVIESSFVTHIIRLTELIDYRSAFPSLAIIEDKEMEKIESIAFSKVNPSRFENNRYQLYKNIEHMNKYLFNDSKASLTWLMSNNKYFLNALVKDFGYVTDKELLKWVIDTTPIRDSYSKLGIHNYLKLFYIVTCDNKLILHQETMDMMVLNDKEKHFNELKDLISELNRDDSSLSYFTFIQKAKLYAYLFETVRRMRDGDYEAIVTVGGFYDFYNDIFRLAEEFEKNNYYGYTGLKEFLEKAEETGKGTHSGGEY